MQHHEMLFLKYKFKNKKNKNYNQNGICEICRICSRDSELQVFCTHGHEKLHCT